MVAQDRGIRADWVQGVVAWCQRLIGRLILADVSDLPAVTAIAQQEAPVPLNHAERL